MVISTACPECHSLNNRTGLRDGGCRPGCPNMFRAEETGEDIGDVMSDLELDIEIARRTAGKAKQDEGGRR